MDRLVRYRSRSNRNGNACSNPPRLARRARPWTIISPPRGRADAARGSKLRGAVLCRRPLLQSTITTATPRQPLPADAAALEQKQLRQVYVVVTRPEASKGIL